MWSVSCQYHGLGVRNIREVKLMSKFLNVQFFIIQWMEERIHGYGSN